MATYSSTLASVPANEVSDYATTPAGGINLKLRTDAPIFKLGELKHGTKDVQYMYVKAGDAVADGGRANVNTSTFVTTANVSGSLKAVGAFAANEYGWMMTNAKTIT